jgi:hypothetical protein
MEPRDFKGMRDGEPADVERLLRFLNQINCIKRSRAYTYFSERPIFLARVSTV